jgi:valyl-tRNA synthetase
VEEEFEALKELVVRIRTLRSECTVPPDRKLKVLLRPGAECRRILESQGDLVKSLAGIGELEIEGPAPVNTVSAGYIALAGGRAAAGTDYEAFVYIAGAADLGALTQKFTRNIEKDRVFIGGLRAKLRNNQFLQNAPPELVAQEEAKLEEAVRRVEKLESYLRDLR